MRAIYREYARSDAKQLATSLTKRLREVTDEFLLHENRDRPDVLEQLKGSIDRARIDACGEIQLGCCQLDVGVRLISLDNTSFGNQIVAEQTSFLARSFHCKAAQQRQ